MFTKYECTFCFYTVTSSSFTASLYWAAITQPLNSRPISKSEMHHWQQNETRTFIRRGISLCESCIFGSGSVAVWKFLVMRLYCAVSFTLLGMIQAQLISPHPEDGCIPSSSEKLVGIRRFRSKFFRSSHLGDINQKFKQTTAQSKWTGTLWQDHGI